MGLPNAGKSSLLSRLTKAHPKVADYPFTTLEPALGTLELDDRQVVIADIPGLIEGAADGVGLGHEFLAHVERCRLLVHLVELQPQQGEPEANYETVRSELADYGAGLDGLPELVALSKADLLPEAEVGGGRVGMAGAARRPRGRRARDLIGHRRRARRAARERSSPPCPTSARRSPPRPSSRPSTASTGPARRRGSRCEPEGEGRWRVSGRGIELLVARHDVSNPEALEYLEQRLREIGVIAELQRAGFERGDEVAVGELEFELDPS